MECLGTGIRCGERECDACCIAWSPEGVEYWERRSRPECSLRNRCPSSPHPGGGCPTATMAVWGGSLSTDHEEVTGRCNRGWRKGPGRPNSLRKISVDHGRRLPSTGKSFHLRDYRSTDHRLGEKLPLCQSLGGHRYTQHHSIDRERKVDV